MRRIAISLVAFLIVVPALAGARLPVVNIASGGVSARRAFGEPDLKKPAKPQRRVVARPVRKKISTAHFAKSAIPVSEGERVLSGSDILSPNRPSSNLWADIDVPLRIPRPSEFSVIRSDSELPEENLSEIAQSISTPKTRRTPPKSENQIAKLNALQQKANESVSAARNENVFEEQYESRKNTANSSNEQKNTDEEISISNVIVPRSEDVIVRSAKRVAESPQIVEADGNMANMTPTELRKAFKKTFLSENKHLSTYQVDDRFDEVSDMSSNIEGFTAKRNLSETGGIRPLEIKIRFRNDDSALSRANYNLLTEYAGIVLANPTRAIQLSIPENSTRNKDERKLAARRLAIVEQVLHDAGVSEYRILPVLSQRNEEGFVLRMISNDQYESLTKKSHNMFGDTIGKKTYKSMSW